MWSSGTTKCIPKGVKSGSQRDACTMFSAPLFTTARERNTTSVLQQDHG